jgi:WXG100 family type VII secretion target
MSTGSYDTEQILQHQSLTRQRADEMLTAITALRSAANSLAGVWTGPAAASFQGAYDRWETQIRPIQESLVAISTALGGAATALTNTETEIARAFGPSL